jgi:hypothetical protein
MPVVKVGELLVQPGVVSDGTCPPLGRIQHIGIAEPSHKHNTCPHRATPSNGGYGSLGYQSTTLPTYQVKNILFCESFGY